MLLREPADHRVPHASRTGNDDFRLLRRGVAKPLVGHDVSRTPDIVELLQEPWVGVDGMAQRVEQAFVVPLFARAITLCGERGGRSRQYCAVRKADSCIVTHRRHGGVSEASVRDGEEPGYLLGCHWNGMQPSVLLPLIERQGESLQSRE